MFANFAAKRHLTGPLRAVSPVTEDDSEIDWKIATKQANQAVIQQLMPAPSSNSQKLFNYFKQAFKGHAPVAKSTFKESLQLFYVEMISLLIPMLYIGFVLTVLTAVIWLFSEPMISHLLSAQYIDATLWACPAVLALGVLLLLVAPLFGGFRSYHGRVLNKHEAPALMALVSELSRHLNVTPPKRIEINNETALRVDAYAGVNSIYRDEYKIIIGAPLLMSLSVNQLAAMLAHELSHFRVKQQKIAFYLMHHVSEWLYFRASGQDKRHQHLLKRMQKENLSSYEYLELWVWQRIHSVQQSIFACLFSLHRKLTSWKCREIEFETDAVAISVVGSEDFASMIQQVRLIQESQNAVSNQNNWAWKEGFLLDDYALAVAMESKTITPTQTQALQKNYKKEVTRFCPNDLLRLRQAAELKEPGKLTAQVAASLLLERCRQISKELTLLDYQTSGIKNAEACMVSSEKIRQLKDRQNKLKNIARQYFDHRVDERILKFEPSEERDISQFDVQSSIDYIRRYRVEDRKQQAAASNLLKRINKAYVIERLRLGKLPLAKFLKEEMVSRKDANAYLQYMRAQYQQVQHHMESMDQVFYQRAHDSMNYLDIKSRSKVSGAFHNLELYCQLRRKVEALKESSMPLNLIVNGLSDQVNARTLQAGVSEKQRVWGVLQVLRDSLKALPIEVGLSGKRVHFLLYLDHKLGDLPEHSKDMCIEDVASYVDEFLHLLSFQYLKWQAQLAMVLSRFENENEITQVNLLR